MEEGRKGGQDEIRKERPVSFANKLRFLSFQRERERVKEPNEGKREKALLSTNGQTQPAPAPRPDSHSQSCSSPVDHGHDQVGATLGAVDSRRTGCPGL